MVEIKELFLEHYEIKQKYLKEKNRYDSLIEKKAMLMIHTQPKATDLSKEPVSGGNNCNTMELFVQRLEELDPEITIARNKRDLEEYLLKKKEIELSNSSDTLDKVYYLKYVKKYKVRNIAIMVNYSKMQVYRKLDEIEKMLQNVTK